MRPGVSSKSRARETRDGGGGGTRPNR